MGRQVEPGGGGVPVAGSGRGRAVCAFVGEEGVSVAMWSAVGESACFQAARHVDSRNLPSAMPFFLPRRPSLGSKHQPHATQSPDNRALVTYAHA